MAHWHQACACWLIINEIIVPIAGTKRENVIRKERRWVLKRKGDKDVDLYLLFFVCSFALFKIQFHSLAVKLSYNASLVVGVGNQEK